MKIKRPEDEPFEIMLIPMIDCMLVLIIFFLVATTMKMTEKQLPVELPSAAGAIATEQVPDLLIIGIDRDGKPYLANDGIVEAVDTERLHQRLRESARANPEQRVRIDGDRNARFEDVVRVMDLCQFEGLKNVGLHTQGERR
jgi:biopolymer transport protein ExbD